MAEVQVDEVIDHVKSEVKKALADAFAQVAPDAEVNIEQFYRVFKKRVYHYCRRWEPIPDQYVQTK